MKLNTETKDDWWEIEALFDLCFVPGREALSSYRLREGVRSVAALCLTARDEDHILAGAVRFWPVKVAQHPALLLGPIAVHPTHQGEGLGASLIEEALSKAGDWDRVMLVGDAPYYARMGFTQLKGVEMPPPTNPERVLGRALKPLAWDGVGGQVTGWS